MSNSPKKRSSLVSKFVTEVSIFHVLHGPCQSLPLHWGPCVKVYALLSKFRHPGPPCQNSPPKGRHFCQYFSTCSACQNLNLRSGPLVSNSQKKRRYPCGDVRASGPCVKFLPPVSKCQIMAGPGAPTIYPARPSTARHILGWCTTTCLLGIPSRRPCSSVTHL